MSMLKHNFQKEMKLWLIKYKIYTYQRFYLPPINERTQQILQPIPRGKKNQRTKNVYGEKIGEVYLQIDMKLTYSTSREMEVN